MRLTLRVNINQVLNEWNDLMKELDEGIKEAINNTLREAENTAKRTASELLPSGGGSYLFHFGQIPARRTSTGWRGTLFNDHQWAEAVEKGTPPHYGPFHIPPGRVAKYPFYLTPDRRGWITFYQHHGARPFRIFELTRNYLRHIFPVEVKNALEKLRR